jgi:large subunit ribosomal protein L21
MSETKKTPKKEPKKAVSENDGSFAIIETGGKQYRVSEGDVIKIEKVSDEAKEGDSLKFDKVLLVDNGKDLTQVGTPYLSGASVKGTLVEIGRNKKIIVLKYKQKSRYLKRNGHRQPFFKVKIEKIG